MSIFYSSLLYISIASLLCIITLKSPRLKKETTAIFEKNNLTANQLIILGVVRNKTIFLLSKCMGYDASYHDDYEMMWKFNVGIVNNIYNNK